ncbi:MAG: NAD(P)-dependent alcohol dehydrogenase [Chitinophagaceae bacterium]|nr:NAD(P)-dependent alcohol dehydrogenase [Chitinophagaceae bacterium]
MKEVQALGTYSAEKPLEPITILRRSVASHDVEIEILYCGICHSDLHTARNEWKNTVYPVVPGHEIVGKVSSIGNRVTKFFVGDIVSVGCMVDSCRDCDNCKEGLEQFCEKGGTFTYNSFDTHLTISTYGGYSESITVDENYVLRVPVNLNLAGAAPLLCAGITTYSPLKHWKVGFGKKIAIVGIGGLGHIGVKIAKAMGAEVTVITTTVSKVSDAKRLGADNVLLSTDAEQISKYHNTFHFILDTVSAPHDVNMYLRLLKVNGNMVLVGAPLDPLPVVSFSLIMGRKSFSGSLIGGIQETQEMLDFCGKHNITSDIELINGDQINTAYERLLTSDVRYRFVLDMASLKK